MPPTLSSYFAAERALDGRDRRKVANNTHLVRSIRGIELVYHHTAVAIFSLDHVRVYSGGWQTVTTKERINWCLPPGFYLYQKRGQWRINYNGDDFMPFEEGMTFYYHAGSGKFCTPAAATLFDLKEYEKP